MMVQRSAMAVRDTMDQQLSGKAHVAALRLLQAMAAKMPGCHNVACIAHREVCTGGCKGVTDDVSDDCICL